MVGGNLPLSLFDRLIDDAPDERQDAVESPDVAFELLKLGLRRDLEGLLNAKRPHSPWLNRTSEVADTVVGFGLADLSTEDFGTASARERIRRMIATCIRTYEPRLTRVEVDVDGAPTSTGVRFRINAVLRVEEFEEQVVYDARLRPSDRGIAVNLAR